MQGDKPGRAAETDRGGGRQGSRSPTGFFSVSIHIHAFLKVNL